MRAIARCAVSSPAPQCLPNSIALFAGVAPSTRNANKYPRKRLDHNDIRHRAPPEIRLIHLQS